MSRLADFVTIIQTLEARGFLNPITWAAIGSSGAVLAGRTASPPDEGKLYLDHGGGLSVRPINLIFVDSVGRSALVVINTTGPILEWTTP